MPNLWVNKYSSSRKKHSYSRKNLLFGLIIFFYKILLLFPGSALRPQFLLYVPTWQDAGIRTRVASTAARCKMSSLPHSPSTKKILKKYSLITAYSSEYCIVCFSAWPFLLQFFYYHLFAVSPDFRIACLYAFSNFCIASTITKY